MPLITQKRFIESITMNKIPVKIVNIFKLCSSLNVTFEHYNIIIKNWNKCSEYGNNVINYNLYCF